MLVTFFDVKGVKLGELRDYTDTPAKCWMRDIVIQTEHSGERGWQIITLHAAKEADLLTQDELDLRVTLAERAAHDDREEALEEARRHDNVSEAIAFGKTL